MQYAILNDVKQRVGRPITTLEEGLAEAWLRDCLRCIRRGFTRNGLDLDRQVGLSDPEQSAVVDVQAEAVARRLRGFDPEGLTSVTRAVDDASVTKRREGKSDDDYVWLADEQWADLLPLTKARGGAFSTRPGFSPDSCHTGSWIR